MRLLPCNTQNNFPQLLFPLRGKRNTQPARERRFPDADRLRQPPKRYTVATGKEPKFPVRHKKDLLNLDILARFVYDDNIAAHKARYSQRIDKAGFVLSSVV